MPFRVRSPHPTALAATVASTLAATLLAATPAAAAPAPEASPSRVEVMVLRVGGTGSAASAQTYIDALMAVAAKVNGWAGARGEFFTNQKLAETWVAAHAPHFGILSLSAYLGLRKEHGLSLLGTVDAAAAGGQQYFMLSMTQHDLAGCKGKTLGTTLAGDAKFVDTVVGGDAFSLADFEVVDTRRPVKTLNAVLRGEVECALVDDAQMTALGGLEGASKARTVWFSPTFPALIVAKFPHAAAGEAAAFADNLEKVCQGEGKAACAGAGIDKLTHAPADALDALVATYDG